MKSKYFPVGLFAALISALKNKMNIKLLSINHFTGHFNFQSVFTKCLLIVFLLCMVSNGIAGGGKTIILDESGLKNKYDLKKITIEDIASNKSALNDLYSIREEKKIKIRDKDILLSLYNIKYDELMHYDNFPQSIVLVKSNNKETIIGLSPYQLTQELTFKIPDTKMPLLAIQDKNGGNCWNCDFFHIITLDDEYFLSNIGAVAKIYDIDKNGTDELIKYEDIWEGGLNLLCHADSPGAVIVLTIKDGKMLPDISRYTDFYQSQIKGLNSKITNYPKTIPAEDNEKLLSYMLQKFLIYRLVNDENTGWNEFNKDIRHYDDQYFYLDRNVYKNKVPIDDIISIMKKSLKEKEGR